MSHPPPSSERGFTILECQIALLVLTLAVILMSKMISSHDVLMQSMDGWLQGDQPTYYVVPRKAKWERYLEHSPDLLTSIPPIGFEGDPGTIKYSVGILSTTRVLNPPSLRVLVNLRSRN